MEFIKNAIRKLYPEIASRHHLPQWAMVQRIPGNVSDGQLSTELEPAYGVDVVMLDSDGNQTKTIYESVPLPVLGAGHSRGSFCFPPKGTLVLVQFVDGSPAHPVITDIYATGRHLPALASNEVLIQQSAATYLRGTQAESWDLRARNKIRIGNADVDLVEEVRRLAEILATHKHDTSTKKPTPEFRLKAIATNVGNITT